MKFRIIIIIICTETLWPLLGSLWKFLWQPVQLQVDDRITVWIEAVYPVLPSRSCQATFKMMERLLHWGSWRLGLDTVSQGQEPVLKPLGCRLVFMHLHLLQFNFSSRKRSLVRNVLSLLTRNLPISWWHHPCALVVVVFEKRQRELEVPSICPCREHDNLKINEGPTSTLMCGHTWE